MDEIPGIDCPTCHGKGGRYGPGYIDDKGTGFSPDGMWEPCPTCLGAKWVPVWPEEDQDAA